MNNGKVVPLQRGPRPIGLCFECGLRAPGIHQPWCSQHPVTVSIDPNVSARRLAEGLASVGMVLKHDTRTNTVVIMPLAIARIEGSQEE